MWLLGMLVVMGNTDTTKYLDPEVLGIDSRMVSNVHDTDSHIHLTVIIIVNNYINKLTF